MAQSWCTAATGPGLARVATEPRNRSEPKRRTEMEIAMLAAEDFRGDNAWCSEYCFAQLQGCKCRPLQAAPPPDHSNIAALGQGQTPTTSRLHKHQDLPCWILDKYRCEPRDGPVLYRSAWRGLVERDKVHSRLVGHSRAITSVFFNLLEDQLVLPSKLVTAGYPPYRRAASHA